MRNCKNCKCEIPNYVTIEGKSHNICNRTLCLECLPFKSRQNAGPKKKRNYKGTYKHIKKFRHNKKKKCVDYLGGKCQKCGYDKCITALQFHHIDPSIKDFSISAKLSWNFEKVKSELDKCILLCANCHAEEHHIGESEDSS